ncbi:uncharacterized protein FA14DRAFT_181472 [Meira miltonrushii]|uniref:HIG1 domain-containing protein n=1 Tax=Meira miltonrushii TaxID=1280837 RepID=A0A316V6B6_9BASI|nr:uncharacterized protein FA14DRAFT_181472 [Meira miltonrushii]PWN32794.1 hypothetical protein FA14DRAFT_181472 [Meira miltonrushii]
MSSFGTHKEVGNPEKRQAQYNAALKAGMKGAGGGIAVAGPAAYFLHRTWQPFQRLTLPLKAMFVTFATVSAGVIAADKAGIAFDQEHFTDEGAQKIRQFRTEEEKEWAELSTRDKALTWTKDNKFGVVAGSWIASMAGIFAYIHNQPMPFSQKLVQTRVWAQGITLASLVAMAGITQIPSAGDKLLYKRDHAADHSWRDFVKDSPSSQEAAANRALSRPSSSKKPKAEQKPDSSKEQAEGSMQK